MDQGIADDILHHLDKCGWRQGVGRDVDGRICLGEAITEAYRARGLASYGPLFRGLAAAARELFPDRCPEAYPARQVIRFNDDPDTTLEDVILVVKHAISEGEQG